MQKAQADRLADQQYFLAHSRYQHRSLFKSVLLWLRHTCHMSNHLWLTPFAHDTLYLSPVSVALWKLAALELIIYDLRSHTFTVF